ncbi:MAG: hypothetical protein J6Y37_17755 [Paludibacteraceae bacterium]|nr:hypothetical protein [Paludibacteraceae bacterium]
MADVIYNGEKLADNDVRNPFSEKNIKLGSRYGEHHTLQHLPEEGENVYRYVPAQSWMPMYCSYEKWDDEAEINELVSVDTDGGPYIGLGQIVGGKKVKRIYYKKDVGYLLELE